MDLNWSKLFVSQFFTVWRTFPSPSAALQVELFFLSLFSFPTGCGLTAALWVKNYQMSPYGGTRDTAREQEGERRGRDTTTRSQRQTENWEGEVEDKYRRSCTDEFKLRMRNKTRMSKKVVRNHNATGRRSLVPNTFK